MSTKFRAATFALWGAVMTTTAAAVWAADPATKPATQAAAAAGERRTTSSGLAIIEVQSGGETAATTGDTVFVHYTGKLQNGTVFDSSLQKGDPISFVLGQGQVIRGWDEGIQGMRIGDKRQLVIPPALGYGEKGAGTVIPGNATLTFDVELVGIVRVGAPRQ